MDERIKKIRKELDLTQQEFANRLGVKRTNIAKYEAGISAPSSAVISLICREFNVNETWLRAGEGSMFDSEDVSTFDAFSAEYKLSQSDRILIEKFISLKPEHRQAVMQYAIDVVAAFNALEASSTEQAEPEPQTTVEEAEAAYIKSRLDAARKTEPSALNTVDENIDKDKIS